MNLSRIDLDGIGSPLALAEKIHELLPDLVPDFDLDALCAAFDIHSINRVETSAYEAAIVMDVLKAQGAILLAKGRRRERERFSDELHIELITDCPATRAFFDISERATARWNGAAPFLVPLESAA